jgi:hypothetical protein
MDINDLASACENDNNTHILSLTNEKILKERVEIIDELPIEKDDKIMLLEKLNGYRYVDEIHELRNGCYLKWIDTRNPDDMHLVTGAFFCEIVFTDYGTCLRMKNFRNRYFEIRLDEVILFQKLTQQEKVLLAALSYMSKS